MEEPIRSMQKTREIASCTFIMIKVVVVGLLRTTAACCNMSKYKRTHLRENFYA